MKEAGGLLIALGILAIIAAFFVTTSSHVAYMPSLSPYMPAMPSDVANLYGMHVQAITFQGGFAAIITGAVLFGCGTLDATLRRNDEPVRVVAVAPAPEEESNSAWAAWFVGIAVLVFLVIVIMAFYKNQPTASADTNTLTDQMNQSINAMDAATNDLATPPTTRRRR